MIDHHKAPAPTQQVLGGLHEFGQGDGEFMPRYGFLGIGIEASVTDSPVGRIAHHSPKGARGKERWRLADVALHNGYAVRQAIADHILPREQRERGLEFQPNEAYIGEAAGQQQRHDPTAGAEIDERVGRCRRDKICEQESVKGKAVAVQSLGERELPRVQCVGWLHHGGPFGATAWAQGAQRPSP